MKLMSVSAGTKGQSCCGASWNFGNGTRSSESCRSGNGDVLLCASQTVTYFGAEIIVVVGELCNRKKDATEMAMLKFEQGLLMVSGVKEETAFLSQLKSY